MYSPQKHYISGLEPVPLLNHSALGEAGGSGGKGGWRPPPTTPMLQLHLAATMATMATMDGTMATLATTEGLRTYSRRQPITQVMLIVKEEIKEETMLEIKEDAKVEIKEETTGETQEEAGDCIKQEINDEIGEFTVKEEQIEYEPLKNTELEVNIKQEEVWIKEESLEDEANEGLTGEEETFSMDEQVDARQLYPRRGEDRHDDDEDEEDEEEMEEKHEERVVKSIEIMERSCFGETDLGRKESGGGGRREEGGGGGEGGVWCGPCRRQLPSRRCMARWVDSGVDPRPHHTITPHHGTPICAITPQHTTS